MSLVRESIPLKFKNKGEDNMENTEINIVEFVISSGDDRSNQFKQYLVHKQIDAQLKGDHHLALLFENKTVTAMFLALEDGQEVTFGVDFDRDGTIEGVSKKTTDVENEQFVISDLESDEIYLEPIPAYSDTSMNLNQNSGTISALSNCPPGYTLRKFNCRRVPKMNFALLASCLLLFRRSICVARASYTVEECNVDCFPSGVYV